MARLGAGGGRFGLGGGQDAAGWRRWRAPAEVPGQAREKSALEVKEEIAVSRYSVKV